MVEDEAVRRGRQINLVIDEFREHGRVDAHEMLVRHGITRLGGRIYELRKLGWDIVTAPRPQGTMAVYLLMSSPGRWSVPLAPRRSRRGTWTCVTCGTPMPDPSLRIPISTTYSKGDCANCGKSRMFRAAF